MGESDIPTIVDMLKVYGPLSLGWIMYLLERRDAKTKDAALLTAYVSMSTTLAEFKGVLSNLVELGKHT